MVPPDRVGCCITGCGRTVRRRLDLADDQRWICGHHWRMAPARWRRRYTKLRRIAGKFTDPRSARAAWLYNRTWERCRAAIEDIVAGRAEDPALAKFLETL